MVELTSLRREVLMAYCRIDALEPWEEPLLDQLYDAAVSYMDQAGVREPPEGTPRRAQYDLCVNALVLDAWDIRGAEVSGRTEENRAFRRRLNQLKLSEPPVETEAAL